MMQMLVIETIELVIAFAILAFIATLRETKPVADSFFADQRWTLADAYKIILPFEFAGFILFDLCRLLPEKGPSLLLTHIPRHAGVGKF